MKTLTIHRNAFFFKATMALLCLLIFGCDPNSPDYSIVVDGHEIGSLRDGRQNNVLNYITDLENPLISGKVLLPTMRFSTTPEFVEACCSRTLVFADGPFFTNGLDRNFISLANDDFPDSRGGGKVYYYEAPAISLPNDGRAVQLSLEVDEDMKTWGNVSLASDVIVMPVHVHVFHNARRGRYPQLSEQNVKAWFDAPNILTSATTITSPVRTSMRRQIRDLHPPIYSLVDTIWRKAKIQFKLASYEEIDQTLNLEGAIFDGVEASHPIEPRQWRIFPFHEARKATAGIHIYVGGSIRLPGLVGLLADGAGLTQAHSTCSERIARENFIMLDHQLADELPMTLAHELGHYLGLIHSTENFSCGRPLLEEGSLPADNLMNGTPTKSGLSPRQIARAREIACRYMRLWGLTSTGCP